MNRSRVISIAKGISVAAVVPVLLLAFSEGPDPGLSGAPGELTCTACHTGTALNGGPGGVTIAFPGSTYTPSAVHRVSVTVSDPNQSRWGFQMSARRGDGSQAGTFALSDPVNTQLNPAGNVQYVQHTAQGTRRGTRNSVTFEMDWTAPSADAGPVTFYVAANAANANLNNTGDRIYSTNLTVQPGAGGGGGGPRPSISQNGVVNGASFQPNIAAGSWITVRGANLAPNTRTTVFENGRYPTEADGVRVSVNGKPAYLYFLSPEQINAIAPDDEAEGPVQVVVTRNGEASEASTVQVQRFSPAFFPWPQNQVVATDAQFNWKVKNGTFQGVNTTPAAPGDVVILWGTGFGPTNPAVEAGSQVTGAPSLANTPVITVGGVQAEYLGGALSPGFAALYQIAIRVPSTLQTGDHAVVASFGSFRSPDGVVLAVQR